MNIVVIANDDPGQELTPQNLATGSTVEYKKEIPAAGGADCYIDLSFQPTQERIGQLQQLQPALIIVNAVSTTLSDLPANFVRINGWPTFLKRTIMEASSHDDEMKNKTEQVFSLFGKKVDWVADVPGFVTARVVSMIINEAYFTLDEKVSSKEEIDTAMKLGTNYPFGPFEWSTKIELRNVYELLRSLSQVNSRYEPSPLLKQEALRS